MSSVRSVRSLSTALARSTPTGCRIRIRFDFQSNLAQTPAANSSNASTWVRVMQRFAAGGMGWQFIPRVGQEVLVDFMDGVIERPIVIAALYNGQGEAGIAPTPGGQGAEADTMSQIQNQAHSPAWDCT